LFFFRDPLKPQIVRKTGPPLRGGGKKSVPQQTEIREVYSSQPKRKSRFVVPRGKKEKQRRIGKVS